MRKTGHFLALCALGVSSLVLNLAVSNEAHARGSNSSSGVDRRGSSCPNQGWVQGNHKTGTMNPDKCYPKSGSSAKIYRVEHDQEKCISGYGREWQFCIEGFDPNWMANQKGNLDKANLADRCPAAWVTAPPLPGGKGRCRPEVPQPSAARLKGSGACKANEVVEWGIWCTSNYEHLKAQRVKQAAAADWNDIYTATRGKQPIQSPDDNGSEVYKILLAKEGGTPAAAAQPAADGTVTAEGAAPAAADAPPEDNCATVGGVLGQAAGGSTGAVLGSMLGSLAKAANVGC